MYFRRRLTERVSKLVIVVICGSGPLCASNHFEAGGQKVMEQVNYVWNLAPLSGCALSDVNLTCLLGQW